MSHVTSPWRRNIAIGNNITVRPITQTGRKAFMVRNLAIRQLGPRHNRLN
jgi:hypothetical protein